jgi:hypothetical protein
VNVSAKPLHDDIPVRMTNVKVVFSIVALFFEEDLPAANFGAVHQERRRGLEEEIRGDRRISHKRRPCDLCEIAYNADRNIATGNRCKIISQTWRIAACKSSYAALPQSFMFGATSTASGRKGQHGRHDDAARPGRIHQDLGIGSSQSKPMRRGDCQQRGTRRKTK